MKILEIGISTLGIRIEKIRNLVPLMNHERVAFSIVHQIDSAQQRPEWLPSAVKYFQSKSRGVGSSRNIMLANADCPYLWFMDDDVVLPRESLDAICALASLVRFKGLIIGCDRREDPSGFLPETNPFSLRALSRREITNIGTPRIILAMPVASHERFPEDVGAGTKKPFGDEAIFLARCLRGRAFFCSSNNLISHSYDSSGSRGVGKWMLRAEVYLRTFGLWGAICVVLEKLTAKAKRRFEF